MQAGFSYFDKSAPEVAIRSLFDHYDTDKNGKLQDNEMQNLLQNDLGLSDEQAEIYFPPAGQKWRSQYFLFEEFS